MLNSRSAVRWTLLIAGNVMAVCVLGFYGAGNAAPPKVNQPFANSVEQREEMLTELREITALLKEQNALLKSGTVKVVVSEEKRP